MILAMKMVYTYKEILEKYGSRYELEKALKNNEIRYLKSELDEKEEEISSIKQK